MTADYLTDADVAILNSACTILEAARDRASKDSFDAYNNRRAYNLGFFGCVADAASRAIFEVLNVGHAYLGLELSQAQIHNRADEPVVRDPESWQAVADEGRRHA